MFVMDVLCMILYEFCNLLFKISYMISKYRLFRSVIKLYTPDHQVLKINFKCLTNMVYMSIGL